jgi:Fe2+ or Zn2+ uptake regulation protein
MGDTAVLTELEKAVVEILRERGGRATLKEVAVELHKRGFSPRSAHGALYFLAVKGVVRRAGHGTYELAEGAGEAK